MERNRTTGNVFKNLLFFCFPYLLSYFMQTLYGLADLFIIGQFDGVAGTTAVSVGSQVMHMLTVMIVGLAMGSTVAIGQAVGAGDKRSASQAIGNTATVFFAVATVGTILLLFFVRPVVRLIQVPSEAVDGTIRYLTVCFLGIPFITAYNVISAVFRGMGDSKSPMYFIAVACVANIGFDYLFMGVLGMGPSGAALGTVFSQTLSVIVSGAVIMRSRNGIILVKADFIPNRSRTGQILRVGIPVAFQDGLIQIAFIIITVIVNRRGLNDAAAVGIVEKFISFIFLVPSSMLSSVSALGAQNIGAGKPERAVATLRYGILISAGFGLFIGVLMQFFAPQVVSLFTDPSSPDGARVIRLGAGYLRAYVWDCFFAGIHFSFSGYFCAVGRSEISFLHNITAIVLMRIPGVYLASELFTDTLYPLGIATACGSLISVIICIVAFIHLSGKPPKASQGGV